MKSADSVDSSDDIPLETIRSVLRNHPVSVAILFGSRATADAHSHSDIDVAVELESARPGDESYNERFFGMSADLSDALETDDVDLVDLHSLSPSLARSVLEDGVLLIGDPDRARERCETLLESDADRSPRDRLDAAVASIDAHLGRSDPVPTDGSGEKR